MRLAELSTPIIELPGIHAFFSTPFNNDQPPYSRSNELQTWSYGDSVNSELSEQRLLHLIGRTGIEVYTHVIPEKTDAQKKSEKCGLCHEVNKRGCLTPSRCLSSLYNPFCGHSDNAGVYPGVESLLHILHIGGVLTEDDFVQHSAWLRIISRKLGIMDVIAKWDSFICLEPGSKDDKYFQLFGFSADGSTNVEDVQHKLERNKQLQERFSTRVLPYLDHVKGKIRRGMMQNWHMNHYPTVDEEVAKKIRLSIETTIHEFWSMDFPK